MKAIKVSLSSAADVPSVQMEGCIDLSVIEMLELVENAMRSQMSSMGPVYVPGEKSGPSMPPSAPAAQP